MHFNVRWDQNPFIVIWEVTRACALACRHCRAEANHRRDPRELSTAEAEQLIDQVARAKPKIFILTGGDPMHRNDLLHLVEYGSRRGLHMAMSPSATPRFLKTDLKSFQDAGLKRISLSLDGATRETHDAFRGVPGTWDRTMASVAKAKEIGLSIQINTTFTRQNLSELDGFVEILGEIAPATWSVFQLVPTGRGKMDDLLTGDEMEALFQRLYALSKKVSYAIKTTEGQHYRRVALQQWKRNGGSRPVASGVNDGKGFVFISHIGEICPSGFLPFTAGTVRTEELIDVYLNAPIFRELRDPDALKGKCRQCDFRTICGGSRARAFAMTGDYLAEEPLCIYQPGGMNQPIGITSDTRSHQPTWRMYLDD
jgi:radical SAM protein with 4Fe4S-binding SPASM domain